MSVESLLLFLVVGLVAGWLAGRIMKGGGFGLVGDLIVGVIGAFLGGWIFNALGIRTPAGLIGAIIMALIGSIVLLILVRVIKRA